MRSQLLIALPVFLRVIFRRNMSNFSQLAQLPADDKLTFLWLPAALSCPGPASGWEIQYSRKCSTATGSWSSILRINLKQQLMNVSSLFYTFFGEYPCF
ncbi:hypothetical protein PoB_005496700 [Plakobranchus ocellatus]|uniref:Secreted protein n=1 Tax=Plakobranchus ocellatus TaxID=259542 RepID=A0AAV4CAS0_9GAST|nr:hypothetical protein PoB_005496700 [Plakobranchus ocellatus]